MSIHVTTPTVVPTHPAVAELDRLGDEIAELSAHLDAATARLLALIREFDARGGWNRGLLAVGRAGTAVHVERIVRGWRQLDRRGEARLATRQHAGRELHVYRDDDGTVVLRGRLDPETGALLLRALDAARETLYQRTRVADPGLAPPTRAQQQADALGLLAESALHHELDPGAPGERYQVVIHVDAAVLTNPEAPGQSELEEVGHVPAGTSRRLACDASRVVMRHDEHGRLVEIGVRTRTIPPALRRALCHRDRTCRFPGCEVRVGEGHHVHHWAQGGPTTLSNLVLLCRRHHRAVHEEGYRVARGADGALRFARPDGRALPDVPPAPAVPADPIGALERRHAADGLRLHARTACPSWLGERLDVGWAIDVLHPLARARRVLASPGIPPAAVEMDPGRTSCGKGGRP
jgi:5-methylcytosine-specific restriction endonuclease McrA